MYKSATQGKLIKEKMSGSEKSNISKLIIWENQQVF